MYICICRKEIDPKKGCMRGRGLNQLDSGNDGDVHLGSSDICYIHIYIYIYPQPRALSERAT